MHEEAENSSDACVTRINLAALLVEKANSIGPGDPSRRGERQQLHQQAVAMYTRGLELAELVQHEAHPINITLKAAKLKALCDLSTMEVSEVFGRQSEADFRATSHLVEERLRLVKSRLRCAIELEPDPRRGKQKGYMLVYSACVSYAMGGEQEALELMCECLDLEISLSQGRHATCQYCGQIRGENAGTNSGTSAG